MTIKRLKELLSEYDEEMEVYLVANHCNYKNGVFDGIEAGDNVRILSCGEGARCAFICADTYDEF